MDNFTVKLYQRAYRDLDGIFSYIANNLSEPSIAENMISAIENAILSLEQMPERGAIRKTGIYGNQNYRQLIVKKYLIIYKVQTDKKEVHIVTVRYSGSNF